MPRHYKSRRKRGGTARRRGGTARKPIQHSSWNSGPAWTLVGKPWTSGSVGRNYFSRNPNQTRLSPNLSCSASTRSHAGGRRRRRTHKGGRRRRQSHKGGGRWSVPLFQPVFNGTRQAFHRGVGAYYGKPVWTGPRPTGPYGSARYQYALG